MYDNLRDAKKYLRDSIIRYKNKPYKVLECYASFTVKLLIEPLVGGRPLKVDVNDKDLNFEPVPLGYGYDEHGNCFYFARIPSRTWKQGLHNSNLKTKSSSIVTGDYNIQRILYNSIKGLKVSFEEAVETNGVFHRFFRVRNRTLLYKEKAVGTINKDLTVSLNEEMSYLESYVKEVTGQ